MRRDAVMNPGRPLRTLAALLFLLVAAATAYYITFSLKLADDEGYLMISIRGFLEGHPLFDSVFTQYGPFYYFYEWLLRSVLAIPLTHDATRLLCIVHWLAAAAVLGWAGARVTHSYLGGLFVFMQAVVHLIPIANEPGHPQEVVALLLALAALVAVREKAMSRTFVLLAVIGVTLAFIKVNVGAFFGFAWLVALRCRTDDPLARAPWNRLLIAGGTVLPVLLMRTYLGEKWCRLYVLVMVVTVWTAHSLADASARREPLPLGGYLKLLLAWVAPAALFLGLTLGLGTSWSGLFEGLVTTPLKMPGVAVLPLMVPEAALGNALVAMGFASVALARPGRWPALFAWLKGAYGLVGGVLLVQNSSAQVAFLMPWLWLMLVPNAAAAASASSIRLGDPALPRPRVFLCLAAAWQGLQGYPIAGTQVSLGTFLMIPVFTLCLADALRALAATKGVAARLAALAPRTRALAYGLVVIGLLFLFANTWCQPQVWRARYLSYEPLALSGSARIRLEPSLVAMYQPLMKYLQAECDTFVTYPGFNSFYFWTGKRPPTQCNSTGWGQLTLAQQEQILAALRQSPRPLLVVHEYMMRSWGAEGPPQIRPLVRCVREEGREVQRIGPFVIYALKQ
jgi:hypothetical protein